MKKKKKQREREKKGSLYPSTSCSKARRTINPFGRWKSGWWLSRCAGCRGVRSRPLSGDKNYFHETRCNRSHTWNDVVPRPGTRGSACFHRYFPCHPLHAWVYNPRRGVPRYALSEPRSRSKFIRVARRAFACLRERNLSGIIIFIRICDSSRAWDIYLAAATPNLHTRERWSFPMPIAQRSNSFSFDVSDLCDLVILVAVYNCRTPWFIVY